MQYFYVSAPTSENLHFPGRRTRVFVNRFPSFVALAAFHGNHGHIKIDRTTRYPARVTPGRVQSRNLICVFRACR